eukprot:1379623-Amorphochlora_amoeboformis.AAC.2
MQLYDSDNSVNPTVVWPQTTLRRTCTSDNMCVSYIIESDNMCVSYIIEYSTTVKQVWRVTRLAIRQQERRGLYSSSSCSRRGIYNWGIGIMMRMKPLATY